MWNPRVGGEKLAVEDTNHSYQGSPPHGRGKASVPAVLIHPPGITPAWAGKRHQPARRQGRCQDHPRMGGEKQLPLGPISPALGSPPHGRGKDAGIPMLAPVIGITPAWAGKSLTFCTGARGRRDHPRMGGEKARTLIVQNEPQGSPPHGRGKAEIESYADECDRITPAWAGKRAHLH